MTLIQVAIPTKDKYGFLTVKLSPTGGFDCKKEDNEVYIVLEDNDEVHIEEGEVIEFSTYGTDFTAFIPCDGRKEKRLIISKK